VRGPHSDRIVVRFAILAASCAALSVAAPPALAAPECAAGPATAAAVGRPSAGVAWRARLIARTPLWRSVPKRGDRGRGVIRPSQASWLLVLRAARDDRGRCWLRVRLPSRPNDAAAWINAHRVMLERTRWRLVVSRAARTISAYRGGDRLRRFRVVIGAPATPTPRGLFSIVDVWRSNPGAFLGSYILPITAHSDVLQEFGGGDGRVGIHGRGGSSLIDPLGSARSHGCIRLSNRAIEWLVRKVGADRLPGIPVRVR
jgi:lipoprotein-anchoring transpeptidase ErfK/SrfK